MKYIFPGIWVTLLVVIITRIAAMTWLATVEAWKTDNHYVSVIVWAAMLVASIACMAMVNDNAHKNEDETEEE